MDLKKKKTSKIPTKKERGACLTRGYNITNTYLGGGATGRVFLADPDHEAIARSMKLQLFVDKYPSFQVAIKIIYMDKGGMCIKNCIEDVSREVGNMNQMFGEKKVLQLLDVFVSCKRIFLVTEFVDGGSLKDVYKSIVGCGKSKKIMPENLARYYFREVVEGVASLHKKNIAHRDLKLENILITKTGHIKVADLGFSVQISSRNVANHCSPFTARKLKNSTFCGTPCYMAPEVLRCCGCYNALEADVWSLGVMLFVLCNSCYPYGGREMKQVYRTIKKRGDDLPYCETISENCKDLIQILLSYLPSKRLLVSDIFNHTWMKEKVNFPLNYKHLKVEVDALQILRIQADPGYQREAIYIRSYLLQRAKLLRIYWRKFKKKKKLPQRIYNEFGLPIAVPRSDANGGELQIEMWRITNVSIQRTGDDSDEDIDSSDITIDSELEAEANYGLSLSCCWLSDGLGSTVGVRPVRRIVKELSTLYRWREFHDASREPITDLEWCIKLYNTVELNPFLDDYPLALKPINCSFDKKLSTIHEEQSVSEETTFQHCYDPCEMFIHHPQTHNFQMLDLISDRETFHPFITFENKLDQKDETNVDVISKLAEFVVQIALTNIFSSTKIIQPNKDVSCSNWEMLNFYSKFFVNTQKFQSATTTIDIEEDTTSTASSSSSEDYNGSSSETETKEEETYKKASRVFKKHHTRRKKDLKSRKFLSLVHSSPSRLARKSLTSSTTGTDQNINSNENLVSQSLTSRGHHTKATTDTLTSGLKTSKSNFHESTSAWDSDLNISYTTEMKTSKSATNPSTKQSTNQSINQSTNQSINQSSSVSDSDLESSGWTGYYPS